MGKKVGVGVVSSSELRGEGRILIWGHEGLCVMGRGEWTMRILEDSLVYHSESDSPSRSQVRKTILRMRMRGRAGWVF